MMKPDKKSGGMMDEALSALGVEGGEKGGGSHKGLAARLRRALDGGNDEAVFSVLQEVHEECSGMGDEDDSDLLER